MNKKDKAKLSAEMNRIETTDAMRDLVSPYYNTDDWCVVLECIPYAKNNQIGRVDFYGFSRTFHPLFVDANGLCLADFCGELILWVVELDQEDAA